MENQLEIVCVHCDAVNRVPAGRIGAGPRCGNCHEPLFADHPGELGDGNFTRHIERSGVPVLVDFWAPWCGPCRAMAPAFEQAARALSPRVRLVKLNTEEAPATAARYAIRSIPTMILFRAGREAARQSGAMRAPDIVRWTEGQLA